MTLHAPDWTGSSSQRRPQGTCSPPTRVELNCEWIPAGTPVTCKKRRGASKEWRKHTTKIDMDITQTLKRTHYSVTFAYDEWVVSVSLRYVRTARRQYDPKRQPS